MIVNQSSLQDQDWQRLLEAIATGRCTPFLGPGVSAGHVPLGRDIAQEWATQYRYPFEDSNDLSSVAQFMTVQGEPGMPNGLLSSRLKNQSPPNFDNPNEPYRMLADLPLSLYVTTTYDEFMIEALKARRKYPSRELCQWNNELQTKGSTADLGFQPDPGKPMVFHLQGSVEVPESLVLTDDDYVDFLLNVARDDTTLPPVVQRACASTLLLFLGLRFDAWSFRIVYKALSEFIARNPRKPHVVVMLPLTQESGASSRREDYLVRYLEKSDFRIYWGTVAEFTSELRARREMKDAW